MFGVFVSLSVRDAKFESIEIVLPPRTLPAVLLPRLKAKDDQVTFFIDYLVHLRQLCFIQLLVAYVSDIPGHKGKFRLKHSLINENSNIPNRDFC